MPPEIDSNILASLLPGQWHVGATNFPLLLTGERRFPIVTYDLVSKDPLRIRHVLSYTDPEGKKRRLAGVSRWRGHDFTGKVKGFLKSPAIRWTVSGASADRGIVAVRFIETRALPAGIEVLVRHGAVVDDLRGAIAATSEEFGLTPEEFARLTWFDAHQGSAHSGTVHPESGHSGHETRRSRRSA